MYTKAQIAQRLDVAPQTVSYYVRQYGEFIPSVQEEKSRYPVYTEASLKVFEMIRKLTKNKETSTQIRSKLKDKFGETFDVRDGVAVPTTTEQQPHNTYKTALVVQQTELLVDNNRLLQETSVLRQRELEEMIEQNKRLAGIVDQKNEELRTLKQELDENKEELEIAEKRIAKLEKKGIGGWLGRK